MTTLLSKPITTALTAFVGPALQFRDPFPSNVVAQCKFTYGSGGTTFSSWLQTSLDWGGTWIDVANVAGTTSTVAFVYNLSSLTPVTAQYAPTDGSLAANTSKDGIIGPLWRTKTTTTGTYAGGTTIEWDLGSGRTVPQVQ